MTPFAAIRFQVRRVAIGRFTAPRWHIVDTCNGDRVVGNKSLRRVARELASLWNAHPEVIDREPRT